MDYLLQPNVQRSGVDEWMRQYVNGLLLCKLARFDDARKELVERFPQNGSCGGEPAASKAWRRSIISLSKWSERSRRGAPFDDDQFRSV